MQTASCAYAACTYVNFELVSSCTGSSKHHFDVPISKQLCHAGETGSALTDPDDTTFYDTFIPYLQNTGVGNDGAHNAIPHVFWWAWNANSGDTKGLVDVDWITVRPAQQPAVLDSMLRLPCARLITGLHSTWAMLCSL